jgi:hypothetical protein
METLVVELINKCYYGRSWRDFEPTKAPATAPGPVPAPLA